MKEIKSEFLKLYYGGFAKRYVLLSACFMLVTAILLMAFGNRLDASSPKNYFGVMDVITRYGIGIYLMISAASLAGKEFDWGTIFHTLLKGVSPMRAVWSKWIVLLGFSVAVYIVLMALMVIVYMIYSLGNYVTIPWSVFAFDIVYYMTYVTIGVSCGVIARSSTRGIIYSLVYVAFIEFALFWFLPTVLNKVGLPLIADVFDFTLRKSLESMITISSSRGEWWLKLFIFLSYIGLYPSLSAMILKRKDLTATRS